ncbi:MAG: CotH kinase family protein [Clostridiales bacterium]|nr:CotH kinase family protein [Clostridiales bacterium]
MKQSNGTIKRMLAFLGVIALLLGMLPYTPLEMQAEAETAKAFSVYVGQVSETDKDSLANKSIKLIKASKVSSSDLYFFLPKNWNASKLRIFVDGRDSVIINGKTYKNGADISLTLDKKLNFYPGKGERKYSLTVKQLSSLPSIFINTKSGSTSFIDKSKENKEAGVMYMVNANGKAEYNGQLKYIRIRGNSTAAYDKKPYQIKLDKKASLCGMTADKTWILLANYIDKTQIHNTMALALARYSGAYSYVPGTQAVDVFVNNEYKGLYLLTEKAEIGKNRLNITNQEEKLEKLNPNIDLAKTEAVSVGGTEPGAKKYHIIPIVPDDITGGYLIQANHPSRFLSEESGFVTSRGYCFTLQEPKYASKAQIDYISSLFQSIEDALFSSDGRDPKTGKHYTELVDLNSFVHRYLQAETTNDFDDKLFYMYKDSDKVDGKVYFSPVWDQDNVWGVRESDSRSARLLMPDSNTKTWTWLTRGMKHDDFVKAAKSAYSKTYSKAMNIFIGNEKDSKGILKSIDQYANQVRASALADFILYPIVKRNDAIAALNYKTGKTFTENITFLKSYIKNRRYALDKVYKKK